MQLERVMVGLTTSQPAELMDQSESEKPWAFTGPDHNLKALDCVIVKIAVAADIVRDLLRNPPTEFEDNIKVLGEIIKLFDGNMLRMSPPVHLNHNSNGHFTLDDRSSGPSQCLRSNDSDSNKKSTTALSSLTHGEQGSPDESSVEVKQF